MPHHVKPWLLLLMLVMPLGHTQQPPAPADQTAAEEQTRLQENRAQLQEIQQSIRGKRAQLEKLRRQLAATTDESQKQELQQQIDQQSAALDKLRQTFENIALGGVDLSVFDDQAQQQSFDWQQELLQILRPLFEELKDLTEKPRTIERLRSELALYQQRQKIAQQALDHLDKLPAKGLDDTTQARLKELEQNWQQRLEDLKSQQESLQLQLENLSGSDESALEQVGQSLKAFFIGRGLTLLLAIAAAIAVWMLFQGLHRLYQWSARRSGRGRPGTRARLFGFIYRLISIIAATVAVLAVLYIAGDLVLLGLAIIILIALVLGFRQYLPRYVSETRLLLDIGAVRERERVIYNGMPWMVRSINVYSRLYNPELEGLLRLPLSEMLNLVSRPYRQDEPWFPTRTGDYVILGDGTFGLVERQTPENVQLRVMGSPVLYPTTAFLAQNPRNLSRGSYGVAVTFGIDYQHQSIATAEVPGILHEAVTRALGDSAVAEHVEDILVDFKEAGASSLDYLVYVTMNSAAAGSYYTVGRIVQRACVETCNAHDWVIPFNQLTVHQGEGFEALHRLRSESD